MTSIEYSFKRASASQSDPTLNKSIFAKQQLAAAAARPPAPIELVSSDEEDCSSGQASSDGSSPEGQPQPAQPAPTRGKQKFYLSDESLESLASQDGEAAPTLDVPAPPCRSTSANQLGGKEESHPPPFPRVKSHSLTGQEKPGVLPRAVHNQYDFLLAARGVAGSHTAARKTAVSLTSQEHPFPPAASTNVDKSTKDADGGHSDPSMAQRRKAMALPSDLLHPNSPSPSSMSSHPLPPAIAVTPSTPVLTARSHALPGSLEQEHGASGIQGAYKSLPERLGEDCGGTELTLPKAASCTSFISASSSSSSTSTLPTVASAPHPPPLSLSLLPRAPPPPPLTLSILPSPVLSPSSAPFSVSMESQEALESALDVVVCAKCAPPPPPTPPSPRPASSLDLLAEVRPGSAPSVGSPKRHSARSRHTSGCYPPFVSRSPLPPEPDATPAPPVPQANGVVGGGPGGGGTAVSSSPTHSGKLASPARTPGVSINRRSSDSDLSITPKGQGGSGCLVVWCQGVVSDLIC